MSQSIVSLKLHPIDPDDDSIERSLSGISGLTHTTEAPGGWYRCSFTVSGSVSDYWNWITNDILKRLTIEDSGGTALWEGRLENVRLLDFWRVQLSFFGYWANLTDARPKPESSASYNDTANNILIDLRDTHMHADTRQISASNDLIENPGPTLNVEFDRDLSLWDSITQKLLRFGDTDSNPVDLFVYEDRKLRLRARDPTAVNWTCPLKFVERFPSEFDWRSVANAVLTAYEDTGTITRTAYGTNTDSVARYIRRELHVASIGTSNGTTAQSLRDAELKRRQDLQQQTDTIVLTKVFDANGRESALCKVRAGDVLRIPDFVPDIATSKPTPTFDTLRTFVITQTECNHDRGRLTIKPDTETRRLSRILTAGGV